MSKESKTFKQYVKELGEMLEKRDWTLVVEFVNNHKDFYSSEMIKHWETSNDWIRKLTYVKMVESRTDMSEETKEYAKKLKEEIYG